MKGIVKHMTGLKEDNNPEKGSSFSAEDLESKINEIRDGIGNRINPIFVAANKFSSNVRQALDLETDPGLLEEPEYGDVICVHRIGFEHYGIYVGDNKVIHYDVDPADHYKICIHQAPMEEFLNGSLVYSICEFPKVYGRPTEEIPFAEFRKKFAHPEKAQTLWDVLKISNYHLYTPEETVIRARERIGETQYSLWTNNCEHFAIWCKTGISARILQSCASMQEPLHISDTVPISGAASRFIKISQYSTAWAILSSKTILWNASQLNFTICMTWGRIIPWLTGWMPAAATVPAALPWIILCLSRRWPPLR